MPRRSRQARCPPAGPRVGVEQDLRRMAVHDPGRDQMAVGGPTSSLITVDPLPGVVGEVGLSPGRSAPSRGSSASSALPGDDRPRPAGEPACPTAQRSRPRRRGTVHPHTILPADIGPSPAGGRPGRPRQASTDQQDSADRTDPMLAAEPTESTDAIEPADPIDRIDPAEPMDRIDPAEPMDRIDPLDPMLKMEPSVFRMRSFSHGLRSSRRATRRCRACWRPVSPDPRPPRAAAAL